MAGVTAGASITTSKLVWFINIDVKPRMTKSEMEAAVTAGKFIFKAGGHQNVSVGDDQLLNCGYGGQRKDVHEEQSDSDC